MDVFSREKRDVADRIIHSMECTQIPSRLDHRVRPGFVGTDELDTANLAEWFEFAFAVLRAVPDQPITQPSLNPTIDCSRHLRTDQEFCGVMNFVTSPPQRRGEIRRRPRI